MPTTRSAAALLPKLLSLLLVLGSASVASAQSAYYLFESGPVRPLAFSPNGQKLFVVNTPDAQLEIYRVDTTGRLTPIGSVPVGLEPVAVAARNDDEVWVVNHLSDSVSVVDVSGTEPRVIRTLLVGDEPNDIVFAGPGRERAFISAAHRGQNAPVVDGDYDTPGVGRADVYVFDAANLGTSLAGDRLTIVTLFGDRPRALARNAAGDRVYAAVFRSGNRTTSINEVAVCDTSAANRTNEIVQGPCLVGTGANTTTSPGGLPTPLKNHAGVGGQETGLIVRQDRDGGASGAWQDELGRDWSALVRFDLPDEDVFTIDASAPIPVEIGAPFAGVGTTLFNLAVHPQSGRLFVSNTEAMNHVRFEGPGTHVSDSGTKPAGEPASVRGNLAQSRITLIDPQTGTVTPRHLNKHIPYDTVPTPASVKPRSLSTPLALEFSADGSKLYVAGFGSNRIGVYDVAGLVDDSFSVQASDAIPVAGGGPSGVLRRGDKLYVTTRFDNALRILDIATKAEVQRLPLSNPEPAAVIAGRPFLYDANRTSSNGEAACASCHMFGDMDDLAWDLGDPDGDVAVNTNPFNPVTPAVIIAAAMQIPSAQGPDDDPSLRGLANMGPQHWRGDRQGNEIAAFQAFNAAFPGLIGRDEGPIAGADMTAFRQFALLLRYPPNPIRSLDNTLRDPASGPSEQDGATIYGVPEPASVTDGLADCEGCHTVNPAAGHFGSNGQTTFDAEPQVFKVPHLRNLYQKVGMFGQPDLGNTTDAGFAHQGPQIRGTGFSHDGSIDTAFRFLSNNVFNTSSAEQQDIEAFMMAFPTDFAPAVGQQVTLSPALLAGPNAAALNARVDLLIQRAAAPFTSQILGGTTRECELVAQLVEIGGPGSGQSKGYLRQDAGTFLPDDGTAAISATALRAKATVAGQELTFSCVPPGSGQRMARDRDLDLALNGLDNCPGAPNAAGGGTCTAGATTTLAFECTANADCGAGGVCSTSQEDADLDQIGDACEPTSVPEPAAGLPLAVGGLGLATLARANRLRSGSRPASPR